ncbi:MAG TPA: rubredoxin [Rhodanobacteraceae bacterium]|nr:rubredoxin [Rhodanobacteraceae bacterium]
MPAAISAAVEDAPFRTFMCVVCGFIYHEAEGWPEDGIEPGTRWEDVPETWTCPDCGVTKSDFEMVEIG